MSDIMAIMLNGIAQIEYNRTRILPKDQKAYLEKMDGRMDDGIQTGGEFIAKPDLKQKAQFVASSLYHEMKSDNEGMSAALTTWLATRLPDLDQVQMNEKEGTASIELIFDKEYKNQVTVNMPTLN